MKTWILPCNVNNRYDIIGAFSKLNAIDWHQSPQTKNIAVGDIAYIYVSGKGICFKCEVTKRDIYLREIDDAEFAKTDETPKEFFEIRWISKYHPDRIIPLDELNKHGLKYRVQGAMSIDGDLLKFINSRKASEEDETYLAKTIDDASLREMVIRASSDKPKKEMVTSEVIYRNPIISEFARRQAKGVCQLCSNPAPFNNAKGEPYLETHHIIWLSKGGADSIDNTVALCPNCHRKMHIVNSDEDRKYLLRKLSR